MVKKLIIAVEDKSHNFNNRIITALYNPNKIVIKKTGWKIGPEDKNPIYTSTPATLDIDLFFDTSLQEGQLSPGSSEEKFYAGFVDPEKYSHSMARDYAFEPNDVRNHVNKIFNLANPQSDLNNRPPICRLLWGGENKALTGVKGYSGTVMFQGLLQNVTKTFTRFSAQGVPTRATLTCQFLEYEDAETNIKKLNPIDDPTRIIKQGETLSSIAREEYGDATLWRVIADANRLTNPRQLMVGSLLTVPPLPRGAGR